jgi:hypothetical protein
MDPQSPLRLRSLDVSYHTKSTHSCIINKVIVVIINTYISNSSPSVSHTCFIDNISLGYKTVITPTIIMNRIFISFNLKNSFLNQTNYIISMGIG